MKPFHVRWQPGRWVLDGPTYWPRGVIQQLVTQQTDRVINHFIRRSK